MITPTKRQWCAMLAKLVAPMDAERAAAAFVDMLPMLPTDDALYTRQTLDSVATCDRRTSVPNFADIARVLGEAAKARMPANVRMGYTPPSWPALDDLSESDEARAEAADRAQAVISELRTIGHQMRGADGKPAPKHLTPLQMALQARACGAIMRPDWARALAAHEAGGEA